VIAIARRRAQQLETLIQMGANLSSPLYLDGLLAIFARHTVEAAHTAFCCIGLLDDACEVLSVRAVHSVRKLPRGPERGERYRLASLPKHRMAVETQKAVIVRRDVPLTVIHEEELRMLGEDIKSAALIPLTSGDTVLGLLTLGEMRSWERSPFNSAKVKLLESLALSLSSTLMYVRALRKIAQAYEHFSSSYEKAIEAERQQAVADFALTVADELAQPLTAIWGFTQLLLKDTDPAEDVRYKSLLNITKSCERLRTIMQNLQNVEAPGLKGRKTGSLADKL
jgi:signal transduction histidine kinase